MLIIKNVHSFCSCNKRGENHLVLEPAASVLLVAGSRISGQGFVHDPRPDDQPLQQTRQRQGRYICALSGTESLGDLSYVVKLFNELYTPVQFQVFH